MHLRIEIEHGEMALSCDLILDKQVVINRSVEFFAAIIKEAKVGSFELRLIECGPIKIECIRTIRNFTGLGLKEAKDATEHQGPFLLATGAHQSLQPFADELQRIGASISLTELVSRP